MTRDRLSSTALSRRALLRAALGAPAFLIACRTATRAAAPGDAGLTGLTYRDATPSADDGDAPPPLRTAATCSGATEDNLEGPFFKPGAPHRAGLVVDGEPGTRLEIRGSVVDERCQPLPGITLEIWQADASGAYDLDGYVHRGQLVTSARGEWHVSTIIPGRYLNGPRYRPAHIHIKAHGPGIEGLTTQLYFPGDPYNDGDPFIKPSLIMDVTARDRAADARFDFVLRRA